LALDERSAAITIDANGETWDVRLFAADDVTILFKSQNETELIAAINDVFRQWDAGIAGLVESLSVWCLFCPTRMIRKTRIFLKFSPTAGGPARALIS
jgi:hypothetical protein